MRYLITILLFTIISILSVSSQGVDKPNIFNELIDNSDPQKGKVVLNQDPRIVDLVIQKKRKDLKDKSYMTSSGYRVQVFSSNSHQSAREEAYSIEKEIKQKLPELPVYVSYLSPFWKVRVGDCLSMVEAQKLRDDIIRDIPQYRRETYIVKDKVLIPE